MDKLFLNLSLIFYYIIPNSFISGIYYYNRAFYSLIGSFFLILYFKKSKYKIKVRELILMIVIFMRIIFLRDYEAFSLVLLILIDRINFNKNFNLDKILNLMIFGIIFYSIYFFISYNQTRYSYSSIGEINISGFSIFILYLLSKENNKKFLKYFFFIAGILTFSRNFLLAVLVEKFINKFKNIKKFFLTFKFNNFLVISMFTIVTFIFIGISFENYVKKYGVNEYKSGFYRYTSLIDNSNLYRFQANLNVLKFYIYNPQKFIIGASFKEIEKDVKNNYSKYYGNNYRNPHNFFYKYLAKYGIFSFFLFFYIYKILGKIKRNKISYFMGYYIYSIILGVGFYDFYLLILKYLLKIQTIKKLRKDKIFP